MAGKTYKQLNAEVETKKKRLEKLKADTKALSAEIAELKKTMMETKKAEALAKPKPAPKPKAAAAKK